MKNFDDIREAATSPRIVELNIGAAKDAMKDAKKYLNIAKGKHADQGTKRKVNASMKHLEQAMKGL